MGRKPHPQDLINILITINKIRIMKQRIKEFCDEYMWFILPVCSSLAMMLGVVIEKHFPLSEILSKIL